LCYVHLKIFFLPGKDPKSFLILIVKCIFKKCIFCLIDSFLSSWHFYQTDNFCLCFLLFCSQECLLNPPRLGSMLFEKELWNRSNIDSDSFVCFVKRVGGYVKRRWYISSMIGCYILLHCLWSSPTLHTQSKISNSI